MRWKLSLLILLLLIIPGVFFFLSQTKKQSLPNQTSRQQSGASIASILITVSPSATIMLTDAQGKSIGASFVQQGIRPPDLPSDTPSPMGDLREFTLQQPQDGVYKATVTLAEKGEVAFYLYNSVGEVVVERMLQQAGTSNYRIDFVTNGKSQVSKQ